MAMALGGGVSLDRAQRLVSQELAVPAAPTGSVQPAEPNTLELAGIARVLALADEAGVPAAELLRAEAEKQRYEARARGQRDAQRLGISLLLPLGLCILPAFVLVAVVPLIVAVLSSTSFGF
jgi:tight adherence protein B